LPILVRQLTGWALCVTKCPINWSLPWHSAANTTFIATPPAGATCGLFAFSVPTGEIPILRCSDERFDPGSCLGQCLVRIIAVPVQVEVTGASQWTVPDYWNHP